ncbi:hypothetical protein OKW24_003778 [Peribacillus simplex]|nr:hypothetical protein [Peribacillus simplex]
MSGCDGGFGFGGGFTFGPFCYLLIVDEAVVLG